MHAVSERKYFLFFMACVLVAHLGMLASQFKMQFSSVDFSFADKEKAKVMKVTFMPPKTSTPETSLNRQIVRSEDSASSDKPKSKAFLSDKDRSFDRQTVSRNTAKFNAAGKGNASRTQTSEKVVSQGEAPKKDFKNMKLSDLGMMPHEPLPKEVRRMPASETLAGLENGSAHSKGLSATNDYVEEVGLGDFTQLNTVEFKFFGFYNRIREKLEQFWGNSIQEKAATIFRSGRRLPASENLVTSLRITMNEKGEITDVKILGASGVKELDDAAIESFNKAGPFPNPPKELLVNGKAVIEWGFVVKS